MKKFYLVFAFIAAFLTLNLPAIAAWDRVGEITYSQAGPNALNVTVRVYRECTGIPSSSITLNISETSCGSPIASLTMSTASMITMNTYCSATLNNCNTTTLNFNEVTYGGTIQLPASNAPMLYLSCALPSNAGPTNNLSTPSGYLEAVYNRTAGNNSAIMPTENPLVKFVCTNITQVVSFRAIDDDGDELEYSFVQPKTNCSTASQYQTSSTAIVFNEDSSLFAILPSSAYSVSYPFHSYTFGDSLSGGRLRVNPLFDLNSQTGELRLNPRQLKTTVTNFDRLNVIAVEIKEFRMINGVRTLVGSRISEQLIVMTDCNGVGNLNAVDNKQTSPLSTTNFNNYPTKNGELKLSAHPCLSPRQSISIPNPTGRKMEILAFADSLAAYRSLGIIDSFFVDTANPQKHIINFVWRPGILRQLNRSAMLSFNITRFACPIKYTEKLNVNLISNNGLLNYLRINRNAQRYCEGDLINLTVTAPGDIPLGDINLKWLPTAGLNLSDSNASVLSVVAYRNAPMKLIYRFNDPKLAACAETLTYAPEVRSRPAQPSIIQNGTTLSTASVGGVTYSWYKDGVLIRTTNQNSHTLSNGENGYFQVMITDSIGCKSLLSAAYAVGFKQLSQIGIKAYPNPATDVLNLEGVMPEDYISLVNLQGKRLKIEAVDAQVKLGNISRGVYILELSRGGAVYRERFIVE